LDIDYILDCLSKINESDLYQTHHLEIRIHQRKTELIPDLNSVKSIILKNKPVEISKQDDMKFRLKYEFDTNHDVTIIISTRNIIPISFNLVTYYLVNSNKRKREDNE